MRPPRPDPVGPGQESVWDYPRPPSAEVTPRRVQVPAPPARAVGVCDPPPPPVYYVPAEDVVPGVLERADGGSWCEWKGAATYWDLVVDGRRAAQAARSYQ